jgi:hypothetical protein
MSTKASAELPLSLPDGTAAPALPGGRWLSDSHGVVTARGCWSRLGGGSANPQASGLLGTRPTRAGQCTDDLGGTAKGVSGRPEATQLHLRRKTKK